MSGSLRHCSGEVADRLLDPGSQGSGLLLELAELPQRVLHPLVGYQEHMFSRLLLLLPLEIMLGIPDGVGYDSDQENLTAWRVVIP